MTHRASAWQVVTLTMLAIDATLLFVLADSQLRLSNSLIFNAIRTFVPTIGGVALVTYLEEIRNALVAWCRHWEMKLFAFTIAVFLIGATMWELPLHVVANPVAHITVDSVSQMLEPGTRLQRLFVRGLGPHRLVVTEERDNQKPVVETIDIGALDVWRSMRAGRDTARNAHQSIEASGLVKTLEYPQSRFFVATGHFPEMYLRRMRHVAWIDEEDSSHVSIWFAVHSADTAYGTARPLPMGEFTLRLQPPPCAHARVKARISDSVLSLPYDVLCDSIRKKVERVVPKTSTANGHED